MDIKNFYFNTPLPRYEYLRLKISDMPDDFIKSYGLDKKETKERYVYIECRRGMYGLPYAGLIAQELLEKIFEDHSYTQSQMKPGLWTHKWRPIQFKLVVDYFGVKYIGDEHAEHLISVVKKHYELTHDLNKENQGTRYCGVTMDWDYEKRELHLSMPG